jgi:hypothetical protein
MQDRLRGTAVWLTAFFLLLLIGSVVFYKERMLFIDPGWVVFNILNKSSVLIAEYRYGALATQVVPLIAGWLQLPLSVILMLYSASFYVFYLVVVLLLVLRYRQWGFALLLGLYFSLFVSDGYFWPNNEVHQGVAWMFVFLGIFFSRSAAGLKWFHHLLLLLTGFLALFSHFIVAIPFSFLWIYAICDRANFKCNRKWFLIYSCFLTLVFAFKYWLGSRGWYDGPKLEGLRNLNPKAVLESYDSGHIRSMLPLVLNNYWIALILLLSGIGYTVMKKQYFAALWTLLYCLGYMCLMGITYPDAFGRSTLFYIESEWMALSIIVGTIFVYKILPALQLKYIGLVLLLIALVRLGYMAESATLFHARYHTVGRMVHTLKAAGIHKALVKKVPAVEKELLMEWGTPVESMLYCNMEGIEPMITFVIADDNDVPAVGKDEFISCFSKMPVAELNPLYFRPDTTQNYQQVRYRSVK